MESKSIKVKILESSKDVIKVKFPFLDIPVHMNYKFFNSRLEKGYYEIIDIPAQHTSS